MTTDDTEDRTEVIADYQYLAALPGTVGEHGWNLPDTLPVEDWIKLGLSLGRAERALAWVIGDWYNFGLTAYKQSARKIIEAPDWRGPSYGTCRNYASVCKKFPVSGRHDILPFTQHSELLKAPPAERQKLIDEAVEYATQHGKPPSVRNLREQIKKTKKSSKTAEGLRKAEIRRAQGLYAIGFCDPPWNKLDVLAEMGRTPPLAEEAVLFMLAATDVATAGALLGGWGFDNVGSIVWLLPRKQPTAWTQVEHRLLLIGLRGELSPQYVPPSTIEASSVEGLIKVIDNMFPQFTQRVQCLGQPREGFDSWRPTTT